MGMSIRKKTPEVIYPRDFEIVNGQGMVLQTINFKNDEDMGDFEEFIPLIRDLMARAYRQGGEDTATSLRELIGAAAS